MDSVLTGMAILLFCRLFCPLEYSTTGLRHGNTETGADHIWTKVNLNGKKSLQRGSNFFLSSSSQDVLVSAKIL